MAGASGFGAFAGGLWQGASSAMQLAHAYQQYQIGKAYSDAADAATAAQNDPASNDQGTTQAIGDQSPTQSTPSDTTTTSGPASPSDIKQAALPSLTGATPKPKTRSEEIWYQQGQADAAIRQREDTATGQNTPLGQAPTPAAAPQAPAATPAAQGTPVIGPGQPVPSALARVGQMLHINNGQATPPPGGAYGSSPQTQPGGAYQDQGPSQALMRPTGQDYTPAPGAPPVTAQDWLNGRAPPGVLPTPPAPPAPTTPAAAAPAMPNVSQAAPAPATPASRILAAVQQGQAQAQAGPSAAAIGAAGGQAADTSGGALNSAFAGALDQAKTSGRDVPIGNSGLVAKPNGSIDNAPSPAFGGVSPARPIATDVVNHVTNGSNVPAPATTTEPTAKQAAGIQPAVAPIPVVAKAAPVAPHQQGNTQQSEQAPIKSPPVSTDAWNQISPIDQQILIKAAREDGQGMVSPQQLAATWQREGGLRHNDVPNGSAGEIGPFQIKPGTAEQIGASDIDTTNFEGGAKVAARYYAHLAQVGAGSAFSVKQSLAYMTGEHGLKSWDQLTPGQRNSMQQMYPGLNPGSDYQPGGPTHSDLQIQTGVINAGNHFGPDGALSAIIRYTPPDVPLSQKWRVAESAVTRAMIMSGHPEGVEHVQEWFAQQSHQGALSNLYAGYQALQGGSPETAAMYLAKAHAFFPDGSMAQFGVDKSHNVWAQLVNEHTHDTVGTPFQITPQTVQQEMMHLLHPNNFLEKLQEMQLKNSEIAMHYAQTDYYKQRPGLQAAAIQERGRESDNRNAQALQTHNDTVATREAAAAAAAGVHADTVQGQVDTERAHVDTQIEKDPYYAGDATMGTEPKGSATQQEIERTLRYSTRAGGSALGSGVARNYAGALEKGQMELRPDRKGDYGLFNKGDAKDASPKGAVSKELGDQLLPLLQGRAGAVPMLPMAKKEAAIGAGMGSSQAAQQPGSSTFGGIQTIRLPQQQPAQMVG